MKPPSGTSRRRFLFAMAAAAGGVVACGPATPAPTPAPGAAAPKPTEAPKPAAAEPTKPSAAAAAKPPEPAKRPPRKRHRRYRPWPASRLCRATAL